MPAIQLGYFQGADALHQGWISPCLICQLLSDEVVCDNELESGQDIYHWKQFISFTRAFFATHASNAPKLQVLSDSVW